MDYEKKYNEDLEEAAKDYTDSSEWLIGENLEHIDAAFIAGAKWQKEQIMKEAVEGKVFMSFAPGHNQMAMADVDLPTNTKVRIIIVKEDEK